MNDFLIVNDRKALVVQIIEEPTFGMMLQQWFTEDVKMLGTTQANNDNTTCAVLGMNEQEFNFLWDMMFKYKLEREMKEGQK